MSEKFMCAPDNATVFTYTRPLLDIEKNFDNCLVFSWLSRNWTLNYYFIALYLVAIFFGRQYMKSRPPFELRGALLFWNVALATYSAVASWRLVMAVLYSLQTDGLFNTSCTMVRLEQHRAFGLWLFLFVISKIVEFGDTVFIVLRKSPLIFLHWYHHVTVAFFVWSTPAYPSPMHIYFCTLNMLVHTIMYSYYALKVHGIRVPKLVSMAITSLQVAQMVIGILIICYMRYVKAADPTCQVPDQAITIAVSIYSSYLVLFLDFFRKSYLVRMKKLPTSKGDLKKLI